MLFIHLVEGSIFSNFKSNADEYAIDFLIRRQDKWHPQGARDKLPSYKTDGINTKLPVQLSRSISLITYVFQCRSR